MNNVITKPFGKCFLCAGPLVAFLLCPVYCLVGEDFVKFTGQLELMVSANDVSKLTNNVSFECTIGSPRWTIIVEGFLKNARETYVYDGTNITKSVKITRKLETPASAPPGVPLGELKDEFVVITPGPHPLGNAGINLLWLAFASGDYLAQNERLIPLPLCEIRHTPQAFGYVDTVLTIDSHLNLPQELILRESPSEYEKNKRDSRVFGRSAGGYPEPQLQEGRLGFTYRCSTTTNLLGMVLPTRFDAVQNRYAPDGIHWQTVGTGIVNSLGGTNAAVAPFSIATNYLVVDQRFRSEEKAVEGLTYKWTNSAMPETSNPELSALFQAAEKRAPVRYGKSSRVSP